MYYRKALRVAGFDPAQITDAQKSDEFILHIGPKELKGSKIGHPMECAGAKACVKQIGATFAWIGATMAILGFADGRVVRYIHNGQLPKKHDQGMFAVGDYRFQHVKESDRPAVRKEHAKLAPSRSNKANNPEHVDKGIRKGIIFHPETSLAAQMRRGWEVQTGSK